MSQGLPTDDPRLKNFFNSVSANQEKTIGWIGHCSDLGIQKNSGRWGAAEGPGAVLSAISRMTPAWRQHLGFVSELNRYDEGSGGNGLPEIHLSAKQRVLHALDRHTLVFTVGGGHDFAAPDGLAFLDQATKHPNEPLPWIINFDAHADVRPYLTGGAQVDEVASGSPFRMLLSQAQKFHFLELGLGRHCNAEAHLSWLREHGGQIVFLDEMRSLLPQNYFKSLNIANRPRLYLSIDIDVFCKSIAPGCSASWPGGLLWPEWCQWFQALAPYFRIELLGIYEVSPRLDRDAMTSELAARIQFEVIRQVFAETTR